MRSARSRDERERRFESTHDPPQVCAEFPPQAEEQAVEVAEGRVFPQSAGRGKGELGSRGGRERKEIRRTALSSV